MPRPGWVSIRPAVQTCTNGMPTNIMAKGSRRSTKGVTTNCMRKARLFTMAQKVPRYALRAFMSGMAVSSSS